MGRWLCACCGGAEAGVHALQTPLVSAHRLWFVAGGVLHVDPGSVWGGEADPAGGAVRLVPDLLTMHARVCAECQKSVRNEPALCAHVVPKCGRGRGRNRLRGVGRREWPVVQQ